MIKGCNNCSDRNCTRKQAMERTTGYKPYCPVYKAPTHLRVRFIAIAMWGELLKWGEIRNASRLRFVAREEI